VTGPTDPAGDRFDVPPGFRAGVAPDQFDMEVDESGALLVSGEVDVLTAPLLWERLEPLIGTTRGPLTVDLGGVRFLDSMGLGVLVRAHKRLSEQDRSLMIRSPGETARKLFALTGLDSVFAFSEES